MEEEKNSCCCNILDAGQSFWDKYRHHSSKISICLSVLGGVSAILVGKFIIAGSVCLAITNAAVFVSGLALEKINNNVNTLQEKNEQLVEVNRRITTFNFPTGQTETPKSERTETTRSEKMMDFNGLVERKNTMTFNEPISAFG